MRSFLFHCQDFFLRDILRCDFLPVTSASTPEQPERKRGIVLRLLFRVYTNYLGVTPPRPEQERIAAVALIGGVTVGLIAIVAVVFFLWQTMMKMGGQ